MIPCRGIVDPWAHNRTDCKAKVKTTEGRQNFHAEEMVVEGQAASEVRAKIDVSEEKDTRLKREERPTALARSGVVP